MNITLYGASWCPSCKTAKKFLEGQKIDFRYVDVESSKGQHEFITKARSKSIPVLAVDDEFVIGYNLDKYKSLLDL